MKYLQYLLIVLAAVLYAASLNMTYLIDNQNLATPGYIMIAVGFIDSFLNGIFSWWANPLAIAAFIFVIFEKGRRPLILSSLAFVLGLQYLLYQGKTINFFDSHAPFGVLAQGYYVWELSLLILTIACFIAYRRSKEKVLPINVGSNTPR